MPSYTSHGRGACETEPAPFCLIACRVLDVPVPEIVLQRAGIAPMVEELITVAMPQLMRSVAARDDADPEHEAVIGTVIACVNVLSLTSRRRIRPFRAAGRIRQ